MFLVTDHRSLVTFRGDLEIWRLGDWEIWRLGDWEIGRLEDSVTVKSQEGFCFWSLITDHWSLLGEIWRLEDWEIGRIATTYCFHDYLFNFNFLSLISVAMINSTSQLELSAVSTES